MSDLRGVLRPYESLGAHIGQLVEEKQKAYGDSFGKSGQVMRVLYPDGIPTEKYDDMLTIVRVIDKLFRVATDRDALGESPWRDIAGYALLAAERADRVEITAEEVRRLRDEGGTGAGIEQCKRAMVRARGDYEEALKLLKGGGR